MQEIPPHYQDTDWARMPPAGRTGKPGGRLRGLSRTTLLELDQRGLIKVIAIRKDPSAAKAIRLVYMPSLDNYLHKLASEPIPDQPLRIKRLKQRPPGNSRLEGNFRDDSVA
jgi:hypothetical protein